MAEKEKVSRQDRARLEKEVQEELRLLSDQDVSLVAAVASRSALRVFPKLLSFSEDPYWSGMKIHSVELLTLWRGLLLGLFVGKKQVVPSNAANAVAVEVSKASSALVRQAQAFCVRNVFTEPFKLRKYDLDPGIDICVAAIAAAATVNAATTSIKNDAAKYAKTAVVPYNKYRHSKGDVANVELVKQAFQDIKFFTTDSWQSTMQYPPLFWGQAPDTELESFIEKLEVLVETFLINERYSSLVREISDLYKSIFKGQFSQNESAFFQHFTDLNRFFNNASFSQIESELKRLKPVSSYNKLLAETSTQTDQLNRKPLAQVLALFLAEPSNQHHQTIGLLGDWGVGKSSFINFLKQELLKTHDDGRFLFADFNAWEYEHVDNMQAGIAQEIITALSEPPLTYADIKPEEDDPKDENKPSTPSWFAYHIGGFKRSVKRGVKNVLWWPKRWYLIFQFAVKTRGWRIWYVLMLLFLALCPWLLPLKEWVPEVLPANTESNIGLNVGSIIWFLGFAFYFGKELQKAMANPLAKELLTYLRLPDYGEHLGTIPVMRKNIKQLCDIRLKDRHNNKRLVFVVDDLDRCGDEGIVKVFEAVRLVLDLPQVTVIIAVDQRVALAALAHKYKDLAEHHTQGNPRIIARDYLAKVIHLPITLHCPNETEIEGYMQNLWKKLETDNPHNIDEVLLELELHRMNEELEANESPTENLQEKLSEVDIPSLNEVDKEEVPDAVSTGEKEEEAGKPETDKQTASQSPPNPEIKVTEFSVLSKSQKESFLFWINYFELRNPRQAKRLDKCYNILRAYYSDTANAPLTWGEKSFQVEIFPLQFALIVMEYLNSLEDRELSASIKKQMDLAITNDNDYVEPKDIKNKGNGKVNQEIVNLLREAKKQFEFHPISTVEPFVLPAIEHDEVVESALST